MEIKCKTNPYYFEDNRSSYTSTFASRCKFVPKKNAAMSASADRFVKRPDTTESVSGLLSSDNFLKRSKNRVFKFFKNYKNNLKHTYDHKIVYALIEKELYGKNSINAITHDADKLIMYALGFPRSIVSKVHRKISTHHPESGKELNLKSMLCDNIASSPEFKPEKKQSLKEFYNSSDELKNIPEFGKLLKKYNFGEDIDFEKIKTLKDTKSKTNLRIGAAICEIFLLLFAQ